MLHVTAAGWAATLAVISGLLIVDWFVLGRRPHTVRFGEAARWSAFYIAVALLFGVVFGLVAGWDLGAQYFAGYVVEKSLSGAGPLEGFMRVRGWRRGRSVMRGRGGVLGRGGRSSTGRSRRC